MGGRSLYTNFLSPSSKDYPPPKADGDTGFQYAAILRHVKAITGDLKKYYPDYTGQGYEIVGFGGIKAGMTASIRLPWTFTNRT